ncbi:hypothetical protein [Cronobacter muytjensii]|uniref:hypothetical protein n=1 Tax=Cronobacter muytjensii TaxID=413501 RepID=UPI00039EBB25|nr:hypothetical protein [Cronobacter muytjensii]ALB72456.1 hypothetical protein AFK63_18335 [Cronobacter muytjensii ATCC 51329]
MMTDILYPHDAQLYDRRFMNCAERHAVVFLKERRAQTDLLFYRALVSSDEIFRQIIQQKKPKYNFVNGCFSEPDLNALGIYPHELRGECFAQIKPDIDALIRQHGFVLISGSVFYFPHCPEYRQKHLHHLVVLNGTDEAHGRYQVADDNPASVLCQYQYGLQDVAGFFDNNGDRLARWFTLDNYNSDEATHYFQHALRNYLSHYQDSQQFLSDIEDYLKDNFEAREIKLQLLHDGFSLLSGSRTLFAHYLSLQHPDQDAITELARQLGQQAFILKSLVVKARITQRLDMADLATRARQFQEQESALLQALRTLLRGH